MGVTLDLRLIDHERIALRGLRAVNEAIRHQNPEILRQYFPTMPVEVDPSVIDLYDRRLAKLRGFNAPEIIIQNEERFLCLAKGVPYRPEKIREATFDELRELLGTWCWLSHSYSLDKASMELHWFLEPIAGPIYALCPRYPAVGDPDQTIFTKALNRAIPYSRDDLNEPVIRTLGSSQPDCSGYNPPDTAKAILEALQRVEPDSWTEHVSFRCDLYRKDSPDINNEEIASHVENEFSVARETFPVLLAAYTTAVEKGFGVSCEYSL